MKLLNYLKLLAEKNWLQYYGDDWARNYDLNSSKELSKQLTQLTQAKLAQISAVEAQSQPLKAIFIVEQNPIHFIASFLASVIAEVNLFLCDPSWQRQEWLQVLSLVKPDLILGDNAARDSISHLKLASSDPASQLKFFDRPLIMIPTGGTSGKIKFAVHSWQTLAASVTGFKTFFACQK